MKTTATRLSSEVLTMTEVLSFEETLMAIGCAEKVQKHLIKSIEAGNRYHRKNLELVNAMIDAHKEQLFNFATLTVA